MSGLCALRILARAVLAFLFVGLGAVPVQAVVRGDARPSDRLFAKYHWTVERSHPDGSASAFVLCPRGGLRFRIRPDENLTATDRLRHFELYVNGKFISRIDRDGLIEVEDGRGMEPGVFSPWIQVEGSDRVRTGLNRMTLVYRGKMGPGDPVEAGPGVWSGEVGFAHCRRIDLLCLLKGLEQGTGWEAETYRGLQVFDGDLRSATRTESLDGLDETIHRQTRRAGELLIDGETRRFYAEVDDYTYSRHATRFDLGAVWRQRLACLERLESFWARSRIPHTASWLYRKTAGVADRLEDVVLARENLRDLYWAYGRKNFRQVGPDDLESALHIGRQNLEVLGDLQGQLGQVRKALRATVTSYGADKGPPMGSEDVHGALALLEKTERLRPTAYADLRKLDAAERELNLYLTLLADYAREDARFLELELGFLGDLIGRPVPAPATKRKVFQPRPKWAK
ncbi:MAG: hypothetical protein HY814_15470 [Candidatus Riflebacteria bacterium]|nr:hypothetical protein [Candidatus Riflebacteria bacterium]